MVSCAMSEGVDEKAELGGLLFPVGIYIVASPIRLINTLYINYFSTTDWEALMSIGYGHYDVNLWRAILLSELIYFITLFFLSLYLVYLFISRHYLFPRIFIIVLIMPLIFVPLDSWAVTFLYPLESVFSRETVISLLQTLFFIILFVPYLLFSKRVKTTFVEEKPE